MPDKIRLPIPGSWGEGDVGDSIKPVENFDRHLANDTKSLDDRCESPVSPGFFSLSFRSSQDVEGIVYQKSKRSYSSLRLLTDETLVNNKLGK